MSAAIFSPIVAIVVNTATGQFHPIVFEEKPLLGPPAEDEPIRHKSKMHRTEGFATREEALAHVNDEVMPALKECSIGEPRACVEEGSDFEWDGEDVPDFVHFFEPAPASAG